MKELNFSKVKKNFWPVVLDDEKQTRLLLTLPSKHGMAKLIGVKDELSQISAEDITPEEYQNIVDILYHVSTEILNQNKEKVVVKLEDIKQCLDFEDMLILFNGYMEFVTEETTGKN